MNRFKSFYIMFIGIIFLVINLSFKFNYNKTNAVYIYDDYAAVDLNKSVQINILANDYGFSDGVGSLTIIQEPSYGYVTINNDNSINYIPNENYVGTDVFKYEICNTYGECGIGKVDIEVLYKDYNPVAINDTISLYWTKEKTINCIANDSNLLNPPISLNIEIPAQKGECYLNDDTTVVYSPGKGYSGADSIKYLISDEDGDLSYAWIIIDLLDDGSTKDIFIPNGFSPNADGINDYFKVPAFSNISNVHLTVFTQWGDIVYQSNDYHNNWDGIANTGSTNNSKVKVGTYFYRFIVEDLNIDRTGFIYINY